MSARPGIPTNYTELFRDFGPFIAAEIRRANTVATNFEDAYQEVATQLLHAHVLERFFEWTDACLPETMTLAEALQFLGIKATTWRSRQWAWGKGYKKGKQKDGDRVKGKPMPQPISGSPYSLKGVYRSEDILDLLSRNEEMGWKSQGQMKAITPSPTSYQFMNYLGRAIRNHFNNFCRTRIRKWKDQPGDTLSASRTLCTVTGEAAPSFRSADGAYNDHWEDSIRDDVADRRIEAQVALSRTLDQLAAKGVEEPIRNEIFGLIADGYTLREAIKKSTLPPDRMRIVARVFASLA
jgi:hypothetical protein